MKLKSFGCSFIFGTDLPDANDGSTQLEITASQRTWPARLAQHLELDYECYAFAGLGNLQIMSRILDQVDLEPSLFVVSWTWIDRFDYVNDAQQKWHTIRPTCEDSAAEFYYRNLHSQYTDKLRSLSAIKLAMDAIKQHGHDLIMTYMDDLIFETQWHTSSSVRYLQHAVQPCMTTFDGQTFLQWARHNKYAINDSLHPGEDAHADAARLLIRQGLL